MVAMHDRPHAMAATAGCPCATAATGDPPDVAATDGCPHGGGERPTPSRAAAADCAVPSGPGRPTAPRQAWQRHSEVRAAFRRRHSRGRRLPSWGGGSSVAAEAEGRGPPPWRGAVVGYRRRPPLPGRMGGGRPSPPRQGGSPLRGRSPVSAMAGGVVGRCVGRGSSAAAVTEGGGRWSPPWQGGGRPSPPWQGGGRWPLPWQAVGAMARGRPSAMAGGRRPSRLRQGRGRPPPPWRAVVGRRDGGGHRSPPTQEAVVAVAGRSSVAAGGRSSVATKAWGACLSPQRAVVHRHVGKRSSTEATARGRSSVADMAWVPPVAAIAWAGGRRPQPYQRESLSPPQQGGGGASPPWQGGGRPPWQEAVVRRRHDRAVVGRRHGMGRWAVAT